MKVSIVIPNWNGERLIARCLKSLETQTYKADIIVVDNGSKDGSVELMKKRFPDVTIIELSENKGFAGGVNVGIKHAIKKECDAVAVFNNDAVADNSWLEMMVQKLKSDNNIGSVGCKQLMADKKHIDSTGNMYSVWGLAFPRGRDKVDNGQFDSIWEIFSAPGGAALYKKELLDEVGLFDEEFFAYLEDVDLGFRAQLSGWKCAYAPKAIVYHEVSATSGSIHGFTRYYATKNFHTLYLKNMPGALFWKYLPLATLQSFKLAFGSIIHRQFRVHLRAYLRAVALIPKTLLLRKKIQKNRKVSVKYIDSILFHGLPPK